MSAIYLYPSTSSYQSPPTFSAAPWDQDIEWASAYATRTPFNPLVHAIRNAQLEAEARSKAAARARARAQAEAEVEAFARHQYFLQRKEQERERLLRLQAEEQRKRTQLEQARLANSIARQIAQAQYETEREQKIRRIRAQQQQAAELEHQRRVEAAKKLQTQWQVRQVEAQKAREIQQQQDEHASLEDVFFPSAFQHFLGPLLGSFLDVDVPRIAPEATKPGCCPSMVTKANGNTEEAQHATVPSGATRIEDNTASTKGKEKEVVTDRENITACRTSECIEDFLPSVFQQFVAPFLGAVVDTQQAGEAGPSATQRPTSTEAPAVTPTSVTTEERERETRPTEVQPTHEDKPKKVEVETPAVTATSVTTEEREIRPTEVQPTHEDKPKKVEVETPSVASIPTPSQAAKPSEPQQPTEQGAKSSSPSLTRSIPVGSIEGLCNHTAPATAPAPAAVKSDRAPSPTPSNKSHHSTATEDSRGRSRSPKRARVSDVDENGEEVEKVEEE